MDRGASPGSLVKTYHKKEPRPLDRGSFLYCLVRDGFIPTDHEHPDVLPQPSQTKQEPAIRIFTPQVMQSGASDDCPLIFSKSSIEEPTPASPVSAGFASIFTSATGLLATAGAATGLSLIHI